MTVKPLFIPLKTIYFNAFKDGSKTRELRKYGPGWNEKTCIPGRRVTLSRGYGKAERLTGVIEAFNVIRPESLIKTERDTFIELYGIKPRVAVISIKLER